MTQGFTPYPSLELYAQQLGGLFYFDAKIGTRTVLLIHGNGDEADTWRHLFVPLAAQYRILAIDLPGFGRSQTQITTIEGFANSINTLLTTLQLGVVDIIGSSLGAVVAATLAVQHPTRVRSLCLISGASPALGNLAATPGLLPLLEVGTGELFYNGLRGAGQEAAFQTLQPYYANLMAMPAADLEFLRTRVWQRVCSDTQRDAFFAALRSLFAPAAPLEITQPTQLIWGEQDTIVPRQYANKILEQIPHSQLSIIAGAGHLPHQEQPKATLEIIKQWLAY